MTKQKMGFLNVKFTVNVISLSVAKKKIKFYYGIVKTFSIDRESVSSIQINCKKLIVNTENKV